MKRNNLLVIAFVMIAGLSSCKKETISNNAAPVSPVTPAGKLLLSHTHNSSTYAFEYNTDRTLKTFSAADTKWEFSYAGNKLIQEMYTNGQKRSLIVFDLVNGVAQKQTGIYYDPNGNISNSLQTIYTYDNKGLLIQEQYLKNGLGNGSAVLTYDNNDEMIMYEAKDKNGGITATGQYEYDPGLTDKSEAFGQFNGTGFGSIFPKRSKHLLKKQTITSNNTVNHLYFSYTMDAAGYVLTKIATDDANASVDTETNTWQ